MIAPTRASAAARSPRQVVAEHAHRAGGRLGEAEQQADQRGLAGAVGAEEAEGDAARHLEVDVVERGPLAEALAESAGLDGEAGGGGEVMRRRYGAGGRRVVGRQDEPPGPSSSDRMRSTIEPRGRCPQIGLVLLLVSAALAVAEAHVPSHGALGGAAVASRPSGSRW